MISFKQIEKLAIDNSPALLTAVGVIGTIGTAALTHKAATKSERMLRERFETGNTSAEYSRKETVKLIWINYIPPVVSGSLTIAAVVGANHIGSKRAAAVAAAYTISEKAYSEYRDKVIERMGSNEEQKVRDEIVRDRVRDNPPTEGNVLMIGSGDHLFLEMYTGRYFRSSVESVKKAVNEINYKINTNLYASVSDFYDILNLPHTAVSDEMGWTSDKLMDVEFTAVLSEDGQPCVAINFMTGPVRDYHRFH